MTVIFKMTVTWVSPSAEILAAKRADPQADTSPLEREIDQLVYQLYGLSEDEIILLKERDKRIYMKNNSVQIWVVVGALAILVLLIMGWRIRSVSVPVGPFNFDMENPSNQNLENQTSNDPQAQPQISNNSSGNSGQPESAQPAAPIQDFNPPVTLPFQDNFDNAISPQWRLVSGNYIINGGKLSGADTVMLQIGNNSLNSYLIEFNVSGMPDFCTWGYNNYLTITVTPTLQYRADYTDLVGRGIWYANQNGSWNEISKDEIGVGCESRVSVLVSGNSYTIYANGVLSTQITYGDSTGAPLGIGTSKYPQIDNLIIREP